MHLRNKILDVCSEREDTWGGEVQHRICSFIDLGKKKGKKKKKRRSDAIYHGQCYSRLFSNKCLSLDASSGKATMAGRPLDKQV